MAPTNGNPWSERMDLVNRKCILSMTFPGVRMLMYLLRFHVSYMKRLQDRDRLSVNSVYGPFRHAFFVVGH